MNSDRPVTISNNHHYIKTTAEVSSGNILAYMAREGRESVNMEFELAYVNGSWHDEIVFQFCQFPALMQT